MINKINKAKTGEELMKLYEFYVPEYKSLNSRKFSTDLQKMLKERIPLAQKVIIFKTQDATKLSDESTLRLKTSFINVVNFDNSIYEKAVAELEIEEVPVVETPVVETPVVETPIEEKPVEEVPVEIPIPPVQEKRRFGFFKFLSNN